MSKGISILSVAFAAAFVAATPAHSQLLVSVTANGVTTPMTFSGGSVSLTAPTTGQAVFATVLVQGTVTPAPTINSVTLTGSSEMTLLQTSALSGPTPLSFTVQYLSTTGLTATGQVVINYGTGLTFSFTLIGTAGRFTYSYSIAGGTATTLSPGGTVAFPSTNVGSSATAVVSVLNAGTATTLLQSVSLSGSGFQVTASPAPIQVAPGQQATISVVFTPQTSGALQGTLVLGLANTSVSFILTGTGSAPSFTVTYTLADGNVHTLSNGSAIAFPSVDINGTSTATIDVLNQGTGSGTVTAVSVAGTGFRIASLAALPATVAANGDLRFQFLFNPTQAGSYSGTFSITLGGATISGTLAGSTASPNFTLSYVDPTTNNTLALQSGGTITFPSTLVSATSTVTVLVANTGAGTGYVNSIALGGSSPSVFQILNQPSLPASVAPAGQVTFAVRFSPTQQQTFSAALILNLNGQTVTVNLTAPATGPQYTYTWSNSTSTTAVSPGGTIAVPNTNVGQTSALTIVVTNNGTGAGQISALAVSGQGLSLANLPTVPFTLQPQGSQSFTLNFAPTQPGAINGTLTIGSSTFTVTATAIGSLLTYSYTNAASTITVAAGGTVIFQPTAVESTATVTFSIQNAGTSTAAISSINLAAASTIFSLQQLPSLPTNLSPGATITFSVSFVPNAVGTLTATLLVDSSSFTLSGTGTPPSALPSYTFQGPSGTVAPAQQPSIGLTLSSPYPLALQGTLTLTFSSAVFTDDPSVQFATGGRTVAFTIPANSTQALFTAGATSMALQTGTTAGTILITPAFTTQNGYNLTPSSPTTLTLTVPQAAPQLSSASVTSETLVSFTLILNGYTTTRGLTQLAIQITPKQGQTFSTTSLTINVSSASGAWFQTTTSQAYGGAFLIEIPFVLSNGSTTDDLVHRLQSLSITATNGVGTSSALTVPIP